MRSRVAGRISYYQRCQSPVRESDPLEKIQRIYQNLPDRSHRCLPDWIFLLETKNWKCSDIEIKSDKLVHQVQRANLALWYFTKDYYWGRSDRPKIRSVVISMKGSNSCRYLAQYIDIVTPGRVCNYIRYREAALSQDDVTRFVKIFTRL